MKRGCIAAMAWLIALVAAAAAADPAQPGGPTSGGPEAASARAQRHGTVIETMDAGRYTYVQVDFGDTKIWAAAPHFEVEVGDEVTLPKGAMMTDHYSKILDRTFDVIYFVAFAAVVGEDGEALIPKGHGDLPEGAPETKIDLSGIQRAEGGKTVGEIFDEKATLAGREVSVRGKIVKFTPGVMGKNWIHLKDGTKGSDEGDDLTVTSGEMAEVGNTILVRGVVSIDRDFGYGYKYDLIIEDADITVE